MRDSEGFENAAALLPLDMRSDVLALPEGLRAGAEELRLRAGRRLSLAMPEGESPVGKRTVTPRDLDTVLENATRASAHTALESVASGFVTVRGVGEREAFRSIQIPPGGELTRAFYLDENADDLRSTLHFSVDGGENMGKGITDISITAEQAQP